MENITVTEESPARRAAVAGLAVVGFFALVFIGMVLAIYAARFVPKTASGLSSAAAYLSSVFTPAGTPATLATVPNTVPFPVATSTVAAATTTAATTTDAAPATAPAAAVAPSAGSQTETATPINGASGVVDTGARFGLPNLVATITAVGYLDNSGNFVPATTITNSESLGVKFTVTNNGTNVSGPWALSAVLPTKENSDYTYDSTSQQSLNPGEHIDFTLHLDAGQAAIGTNEAIKVTADNNNQVIESNENDNVVSSTITVNS